MIHKPISSEILFRHPSAITKEHFENCFKITASWEQ